MEARRAADKTGLQAVTCWLAQRASEAWDFVDKRDIDKHIVTWWSFYVTFYLLDWALEYVFKHPDKPGLEVAAIVGAIMVPWTPVQGAIVKWYFEARA
jgi:hypothetical protein